MSDLFLIFSHTITPLQEKQAYRELGVEDIITPPQEISNLWAAIPPDEEKLIPLLQPVLTWLDKNADKGDFVLIQGDFGACYLLIQHALNKDYIPVYSTTERKAVERRLEDDQVELIHQFNHIRFREYGK